MKLEFGFGTGVQCVEVPEKNLMGVLMSNDVPRELMNEEEVVRALEHPIGTPRLRDIVKPGEKIAVVTSDITRPCPTYRIMPALLDELYAAGCRPEDIALVFALGVLLTQSASIAAEESIQQALPVARRGDERDVQLALQIGRRQIIKEDVLALTKSSGGKQQRVAEFEIARLFENVLSGQKTGYSDFLAEKAVFDGDDLHMKTGKLFLCALCQLRNQRVNGLAAHRCDSAGVHRRRLVFQRAAEFIAQQRPHTDAVFELRIVAVVRRVRHRPLCL